MKEAQNQLMGYGSQHKIYEIAMVCHQANKAWCELNGDISQKNWNEAEQWQRDSVIKGVAFKFANPSANEETQHNAWMMDKINDGWEFGEIKDAVKKTHPCIVHFDQLTEFQKKKDTLRSAIIEALK